MKIIDKQKRNMFQQIFGNKQSQQPQQLSSVQLLNSYTSKVYNYSGDLYDNDVIRSCIDCIAKNMAKTKPTHRLKGIEQNSTINKLIGSRWNEYMSSYDAIYKVITALYMQNNAYIYLQRDMLGNITALYPVLYSQAELKQDNANNFYLEFTFNGNQKAVTSLDNIIVLRRHFYNNDFFGESNTQALYPVVNLLHTIDQSIINAVKTSAIIRGILKYSGMLQDKDKTANKQKFESDYLSASNNGGIVVTDGAGDYIPIESKPIMVDDKMTALANDKVFTFFGISENIVKGKYNEDEWQAFYESCLEPIIIQLSQELTSKIFTQREQDFGNKIVLEANRLNYMSTTSKVNMINAVKEMGVLSKGTIADILNIQQPPDADEFLQSLNYVNSKIANKYQLGNGGDTKDDKTNNGQGTENTTDNINTDSGAN